MVQSFLLIYLAPAIGLSVFSIGLAAVILPSQAAKGFGVLTEKNGLAFVRATGVRDIFMGLIIWLLCWRGDTPTLAYSLIFAGAVAVVDFFIVISYGVRKFSLVHLSGAIICLAFASWLLRIH